MLHNDIYAWLSSTPEIDSLFPGGIHHESLPQDVDEWPALTFSLVSQREIAADMEAPNDEKLDSATYQFDVIANASQPALTAADSFLSICRNFRGTMTTTKVQEVDFLNVTHFEERRGDKLRRRVSLDFSITYEVTE